MKNLIFFFALACTSLMTSCQKEPMTAERTTTSFAEQWVLLDQNWSVDVTTGTPSTFVATGAGLQMNGTQITVAQLPVQVTQRLQTDGVNLTAISETWSTSTGGYVVKVQVGGETHVYWFTNASTLRSVGKVSV